MKKLAAGMVVALMTGGLMCQARAEDTTSADKTFIADSTQGSLAEIAMGKLALEKSQDKNVREFASRMIKDHTKMIADMKPLGAKLGVKEPTGPSVMQKAKYEELKLKSGTGFDRAYVEAMVKDHHEDLKEFMDEEMKTGNPQLKATVAKGEKVIKEHTEMIDNIAHMGGISTPAMPAGCKM